MMRPIPLILRGASVQDVERPEPLGFLEPPVDHADLGFDVLPQPVAGDGFVSCQQGHDGICDDVAPHVAAPLFKHFVLTGFQPVGFLVHQMRPSVLVTSGVDRDRGALARPPIPPAYQTKPKSQNRQFLPGWWIIPALILGPILWTALIWLVLA